MEQFQSQGTVTTAPPPPIEVKIRTMSGDIAMMAASGGGLPQFENVKVSGISARAPAVAPAGQVQGASSQVIAATSAARQKSKSNLLLIVALIVILAAAVAVAWLVYLKFKG
jgi:hypothetical protein